MSEGSSKNLLEKVISWLGVAFCFLLFPAFVIETSLTSLLELRRENRLNQDFRELSRRNGLISSYDDERKYFARVFKKIFDLAEKQNDSLSYLKESIDRLKINYPDQLEFVVWNSRGEIVEKLTDEKRYRYVLKKLFHILLEVRTSIVAESSVELKEVSGLKNNLSLVRQFLGRIFLPETLRLPYQKDGRSALVLADYGRNRPYFWYHVSKKFGFLVFVNWETIKGNYGLERLCRTINRQYPDSFCGFTHISDLGKIYPEPPPQFKFELINGLARFENMAEQEIEQNETLLSVHLLNSRTRIFNLMPKKQRFFKVADQKNRLLVQIMSVYGIGLTLLLLNFYMRKVFLSIRWKLLLLFLYSNLAPLSILGFIAYDYLQHYRISLRSGISFESDRLLRDFDARFALQNHSYNQRLYELISGINRGKPEKLSNQQIAELKKSLAVFRANESFLFDDNGNTIFAFSSTGKNLSSSVRYFKTLAEGVLKYMNRIIQKSDKSDVLSKITSPEDSDFIRNSIRDSRKIWPIAIGDSIKMGYWNFIGEPDEYKNRYFLLLLWSEEELQRIYSKNFASRLHKNPFGIKVYARSRRSGNFFIEPPGDSESIAGFMRLVEERGVISGATLQQQGESFVATGMVGNKLSQTTLCAVFPEKEIDRRIAALRNNLFASGILSILLTTVIGLMVARQFMDPVKKLAGAAAEISRQNYRHRLQGLDHDEFGQLAQTLNRVTEGLGEMQIAKVVQESLFPEEHLSGSDYAIYGRSVVMTTLGGDYFDYFAVDNANIGVIIGDVAGHGVGAALIMAMAKARVALTGIDERLDPALMCALVNEIILSFKGSKLRRMMTFQYLVFNHETGLVRISNAGHCYPVLLNAETRSCEFVELVGNPLGISPKSKYKNVEFHLPRGSSLVLYTDGMVESQNAQTGEPLGFPGFANMVLSAYCEDAQKFYENIYSAQVKWAGEAGDDTTLVILDRKIT